MTMTHVTRPVIGITCGDINGIGTELIIKTLSDHRILEHCTPVIFGSNKLINFYKKSVPEANFSYQSIKEFQKLNTRQVNVFNCWEEDINITPGQLTDLGGKYAVISLLAAADAMKQGNIHGIVTAPIHKKNVRSENFNFTGHTPFFQAFAGSDDVLMLLYSENIRIALATEHVPVVNIGEKITRENLLSKINLLHSSLRRDFGIDKPKIAVLGLNPHAGDEGLIGKEEEAIIKPAIKDARKDKLVFGPYSADAFFARRSYLQFDAVLAMYHDQGLIPFKTIAIGEGVNFSAGLPFVRTSPDHGTAFDIAGKNKADETSFTAALFECIQLLQNRKSYDERNKNPLRKITAEVLRNVEDEKIDDTIDR